jgi:protoporphyrinogen oxidase
MHRKRAIIIGAGPARLTAAYELLTRAGIKPIVLEKSDYMGGISRTVNYKGNRSDIGGHRFFCKSDRVMEWWLRMLPLQASENGVAAIKHHRMAVDDIIAGKTEKSSLWEVNTELNYLEKEGRS